MHRTRILDALESALTVEQHAIVAAVLMMYDHGLLKLGFCEDGEIFYDLRDNITDRQWNLAMDEWKQMNPGMHTYGLWRDAQ
jgi:hypothetical protein